LAMAWPRYRSASSHRARANVSPPRQLWRQGPRSRGGLAFGLSSKASLGAAASAASSLRAKPRPEAYASTQPRWPHAQGTPSGTTWVWRARRPHCPPREAGCRPHRPEPLRCRRRLRSGFRPAAGAEAVFAQAGAATSFSTIDRHAEGDSISSRSGTFSHSSSGRRRRRGSWDGSAPRRRCRCRPPRGICRVQEAVIMLLRLARTLGALSRPRSALRGGR